MCVPIAALGLSAMGTLAATSAATGVASAAIGSLGAIRSAEGQANAAKYDATIQSENSQVAQKNAQLAGQEGEVNASAAESKTRAQIGGILANQGASGVDVNSGSEGEVRSSAAELGELNAINIRSTAARTAYGDTLQGVSDTAQGTLDTSEASNDMAAGGINAGSTLLSGLAQTGSQYGNYYLASQGLDAGSGQITGPGSYNMVQQ